MCALTSQPSPGFQTCAVLHLRAELNSSLCPVHVLEALQLMSESLCLCFSSPTLSHLHFSTSSLKTALFRLSLTGLIQTCRFPALSPHPPRMFQASGCTCTHNWTVTATAGWTAELVCEDVFSILETKHDWTKAGSRWIKMCPHQTPSFCTKFYSTHQYYYWCYFCMAAGSKLLFN